MSSLTIALGRRQAIADALRALHVPAAVATIGVVTAVSAYAAYFAMYSLLASYDDEGYILIALKGFLSGAHLYDQVYSQYGPAYYVIFGSVFTLFHLPVDHDHGRLVTLILWVTSALLVSVATFAITRRVTLAVSVQLLAFAEMLSLANEPMHPGGILNLLVAVIVASAALFGRRAPRVSIAVVFAAAAACCLIKVNVGIFAVVAVAFACVYGFPALSTRFLRLVAGAAMIATPIALMGGQLRLEWVREYGFYVSLCAAALVAAAAVVGPDTDRPLSQLAWPAAAFAAVILAVAAVLVVRGDGLASAIDGVFIAPQRQPLVYVLPAVISKKAWVLSVLLAMPALLLIAGRWAPKLRLPPVSPVLSALARIGAGLVMWTSLAGSFTLPGVIDLQLPAAIFGLAPALAWVAVLPPKMGARGVLMPHFTRFLLPALAIMETLQAYPVAGSQSGWARLLLIPVGAVCIADGLDEARLWSDASVVRRAVFALPLIVALPVLLRTQFNAIELASVARYQAAVPLAMPGADRVRVEPAQAAIYHDLTAALRTRCSTFVTEPGLDSLYFFSREAPPTWLNVTSWMLLLDDSAQQRVVDRISAIPNVCVVRNQSQARAWMQGRPVPQRPLVEYIDNNFEPVAAYGDDELLVPRGSSGA